MRPIKHAIMLIRAMNARVMEQAEEAQMKADDEDNESLTEKLQEQADAIHDAVAELEQTIEGLESYD